MNELARGILFWLPYFLLGELLALFWKGCPWPMLTITVRDLIKSYPGESVLVTLFIFILWGHFERGWSVWWLIASGLLCAAWVGVKYIPW